MPSLRSIIEWLFLAACIWGVFQTIQFALWNLKRCRQAAQVRSTAVLPLVWKQLYLQLHSKNGWKVAGCCVSLLFLPAVFYFCQSVNSCAIVVVGLFYALFNLTEFSVPASILLLGSSNLKSLCLFSRLDIEAFPYRTIFLLAPSDLDFFSLSEQAQLNFRYNNVRQSEGDTWQETLLSLAEDTPVIVIDGRHRAIPVDFEVGVISSQPALLAKTFVVSKDSGETPALEGLPLQQRKLFRCVSERLSMTEALTEAGLTQIISWRQKSHWERMFYQIAYNAIAAQTKVVSRNHPLLDLAVKRHTLQFGLTPFCKEFIDLLDRFGQGNGKGLLGAIAGVDTDIEILSTFLVRWNSNRDSADADAIVYLTATLNALHRLKMIAESYPEIWEPQAVHYFPQFGFANRTPSK